MFLLSQCEMRNSSLGAGFLGRHPTSVMGSHGKKLSYSSVGSGKIGVRFCNLDSSYYRSDECTLFRAPCSCFVDQPIQRFADATTTGRHSLRSEPYEIAGIKSDRDSLFIHTINIR